MLIRPPQLQFFEAGIKITATGTIMSSNEISQILNSMHEGDGFYYKLLEEAYFIV